MDQVEEVKSKIDIVELISEFVPLKKAGRNYKGLCPFHGEKTPSFMVNPELQIFKCFGCGVGGDAYSFIQKTEGVEFGEALRILADRAGVKLVSYQPTQTEEIKDKLLKINNLAAQYWHYLLTEHEVGKPGREYLLQRMIGPEAIEAYKIGFAPEGWDYLIKYLHGKKGYELADLERAGLVIDGRYDRFRNRIMFPVSNHRNQVVGFSGRVIPGSRDQAKYINTPETEVYHKSDTLYGLEVAKGEIKKEKTAVLVEGQTDTIASWQAGVRNAVGVGGTALTPKQVEILHRLAETVVFSLDTDLAGDMAARRGIEIALKTGLVVKVTNPKSQIPNFKYKDPGECATMEPELWKKIVDGAAPIYDYYLTSAVDRHGLDAVGKGKISRELVPIWAGIDDEIVKAHYIGKLAEVLGVREEDVRAELNRTQNAKLKTQNPVQNLKPPEKKTRRDVLEEYIVGLAFRNDKVDLLISESAMPAGRQVNSLFRTEFWRKTVNECLVLSHACRQAGAKYSGVREIITNLPAELRGRVEELMLIDDEMDKEEAEKEWQKAVNELEEVEVREKIEKTRAPGQTNPGELRKLTERLAELTKRS
jgi:DNA primase